MGESASGTIAATQLGPSSYRYTVTLDDTGSTTLGTFWFGWVPVPFEDFLGTSPSTITAPAGWTDNVTNVGSTDGFAIEWIASSTSSDLEPGGSTSEFSFVTSDPPSAVFGDSVFYPGVPVTTSFVYSGTPFSDPGSEFVVSPTQTLATSDIFWQNVSSGQASIWDMNGNSLTGGGAVCPNPGPSWTEIGTGDFNHDGHSDILWQNADGQASIWDMNGNSLIGGGPVSPNPGPAWKAVGTGDFFGNGDSDILWQNTTTGQVSIWEMSGNTLKGGGPVSPDPGPAWQAIGTGDFNKDGFSDILWQNTSTGQVSIWEMHGNTLMGGGAVIPNPGLAWKAIGTGDFTDDSFSDDILFQNKSSGQLSIWEMNGNNLIGGGPVSANPGPNWHVMGTDEGSDILLQNTSGQASVWEMNGSSLIAGGTVSPNPGPNWHAIALT